jgi:hypothetical protein
VSAYGAKFCFGVSAVGLQTKGILLEEQKKQGYRQLKLIWSLDGHTRQKAAPDAITQKGYYSAKCSRTKASVFIRYRVKERRMEFEGKGVFVYSLFISFWKIQKLDYSKK